VIGRPGFAFTGTLARRLSSRVEARALFSFVNLGNAEGRRRETDMRADWSVFVFGGVVAVTPIPLVRIGAGPLLGLLNSARIDNEARTVVRPGVAVEGAIRTSAIKKVFLEVSAAYRFLAKRAEGPWPGRQGAAVVAAGPEPFDANFSHLFVSIGMGVRFSSNADQE
jgi:hypothetical protein